MRETVADAYPQHTLSSPTLEHTKSMSPHAAYEELVRLSREISVLSSCADLLEWDEETYMPRGGVEHRAEQSRLLAGLLHERITSPRLDELLSIVEHSDLVRDPDTTPAVNVRELRRQHDRKAKLPLSLVRERASIATLAQQVWIKAREDADYSLFCPWVDRVYELARQEAAAIGYSDSMYDALLDEYEPGATTREVSALFNGLREALAPMVRSLSASRKKQRTAVLRREFPIDRQKILAQAVAAALGFDLEGGRLDIAAHPFCIALGPGDTRLTLRYDAHNFSDGFFAMLHEVGHGLYDQGLDHTRYGTPMGDPASLGMHESQSRLWENFVGRSMPFWKHFYPRLRSVFPEALGSTSVDTFHRAINAVGPSLDRSMSDEVTYNLHIFIRFDLERELLEGSLTAAELPEAWRSAYRNELGVEPANDVEGCLQDGHWSQALIGYFPTYTLGNIYAAQLYAAARTQHPGMDDAFARGDFSMLLHWLRENVYKHGQRYRAAELVQRATGSAPDPQPLIDHLKSRYIDIT